MANIAWFEGGVGAIPNLPPRPGAALRAPSGRRHRSIFISDTHLGTRHC